MFVVTHNVDVEKKKIDNMVNRTLGPSELLHYS